MRQAIILLLTPPDREEVLFGIKKQGHHRRRVITPSETMEPGETRRETALRCLREEAEGIRVTGLRQVGRVLITRGKRRRKKIELFIFRGTFTGWPKENDELKSFRLFPIDGLPLDKTWIDAYLWMPRAFAVKTKQRFDVEVAT